MRNRRTCTVSVFLLFLVLATVSSRGDIYQWEWVDPGDPSQGKRQSETVCPGGAGVDAGPYVLLSSRDLTQAYLIGANLSNAAANSVNLTNADLAGAKLSKASFSSATLICADLSKANLAGADFKNATLTGSDLSGANLAGADLYRAKLEGADLTDAMVAGSILSFATSGGFSKEQLYSTASYKAKDLQKMKLDRNDLSGWNFVGQNLAGADFEGSTLVGVDFRQANLAGVDFHAAALTGANLSEASLAGATFDYATLTDTHLSRANLSGASLYRATLTGADLSDTVIMGAVLSSVTSRGFTKEQLYSTASYKAKDLQKTNWGDDDLSGWSFVGQNLAGADFYQSTLAGTDLTDAVIAEARFEYTTSRGFTKEQLYSTASYKAKDLRKIGLNGNDLSGWNFAGQSLVGAILNPVTMTDTDLGGADLRGANAVLTGALMANTIRPDGTVWGLSLGEGERLVVRDYDRRITVRQGMTMTGGSALEMRLLDGTWGSRISFDPGIGVSLGGELELSLDGDARLSGMIGKTFSLFRWQGANVSGTFGQIAVEPGSEWDTTGLYTAGEVRLLWAMREPAVVLSWDGQLYGEWNSTSHWVGGQPGQVPDGRSCVEVSSCVVAVGAEAEAHSLWIEADGRVIVEPGQSLWVYSELGVGGGCLEVGGTLRAGSATVTAGTLKAGATGVLEVHRDLAMSNAEYLCELSQAGHGRIVAEGHVAIGPGSGLDVKAVTMLTSPGTWGDLEKMLVTASGVSGRFAEVPAVGEHLGHGVLYEGSVYEAGAVKVGLFQAGPGDVWNNAVKATGADRTVEVADIQQILRAAKFSRGEAADWTEGDFSDDGLVTAADIQLVLSANLFKKGLYASGAAATVVGSVPHVELKLTEEGLVIDTRGAVVNGYVLNSAAGLLTGEAAENLGVFRVDSDGEISGQMFFALCGEHLLGRVVGAGISEEQLAQDLRLSYTVAGQAGVFEATVVVPEPGAVGMMLSAAVAVLVLVWRRRRERRGRCCGFELCTNDRICA